MDARHAQGDAEFVAAVSHPAQSVRLVAQHRLARHLESLKGTTAAK
ncbi:MAG: hypothetical protein H7343_18335 [Undibacterium sp.]|nr:hypothetical protein [Opitutaceae bacterium]